MEQFTIVCGWCKKIMEPGPPGARVSHGCCEECQKKVLEENKK